jgi:hypothetical protein
MNFIIATIASAIQIKNYENTKIQQGPTEQVIPIIEKNQMIFTNVNHPAAFIFLSNSVLKFFNS